MPVEFGPNRLEVDDDMEESPRAAEAMREAVAVAVKSAAGWVVISAVLYGAMIQLMRAAVQSAEEAISHGEIQSGIGPGVLFAIVGLGLGALISWRFTTSSGLTGGVAWLIGAGAMLVLGLIGAGIFLAGGSGVPIMGWVCLGVTYVVALLPISYFTIWGN